MNIIRVLRHIDVLIHNNINIHQFTQYKLYMRIFGLELNSIKFNLTQMIIS